MDMFKKTTNKQLVNGAIWFQYHVLENCVRAKRTALDGDKIKFYTRVIAEKQEAIDELEAYLAEL